MPNNKTPGNDGFNKELYETFRSELKVPLLKPIYHLKHKKSFPPHKGKPL